MEKAIMAHLRVPNPSILSIPSSSTASLLTPPATSSCSSFVYNEGEIILPKQTRNGPLNHPASTGAGGVGGARASNGLLGKIIMRCCLLILCHRIFWNTPQVLKDLHVENRIIEPNNQEEQIGYYGLG